MGPNLKKFQKQRLEDIHGQITLETVFWILPVFDKQIVLVKSAGKKSKDAWITSNRIPLKSENAFSVVPQSLVYFKNVT